MFFRRKRVPLTAVKEINDLLAADPAEREQLISGMSEAVVKALLLYHVNGKQVDRG